MLIVIKAFHNHKDLGDLFWIVQEYIHNGEHLTTQIVLQSQLLCHAIMRYLLNSPSKKISDWTKQMSVDAIKIPKIRVGGTHLQMIWLKKMLLIDYNGFDFHGDSFLQKILQKKLRWKGRPF